jgi:hypothetical protein
MIQIMPDQRFDAFIKGKRKGCKVNFTFNSGSGMKLFVAFEAINPGIFGKGKIMVGLVNPETGDLETLVDQREVDQANEALDEIWRESGRKKTPRLKYTVITARREQIAHFE